MDFETSVIIVVLLFVAIPVGLWWLLRPTDHQADIQFPVDHRDHIYPKY